MQRDETSRQRDKDLDEGGSNPEVRAAAPLSAQRFA
jgi:hypothetical protein